MRTREFAEKLKNNIGKVIKGKEKETELAAAALVCGGHVLLEDVPGTGKTVFARAMAKSLDCDFRRIQFTPDLLPSDITGINFYNMKEQEFRFRKGPVFTNILLADEINRATPRTQSALLECMEERQTTIDGETHSLSEPFFVVATQNPVETAGTYPLPEAQLDRFLIRMSLGYTDRETEIAILSGTGENHPVSEIGAVLTAEDLLSARSEALNIRVNEAVLGYISDLGAATRNHEKIRLGLSTRGLIALKRMAQAYAAVKGMEFVNPDCVKAVAPYVIPHRLVCRELSVNLSRKNAAEEITQMLLDTVPVPTEEIG
ncbi:MAG: MoxR family ATPase [Oscillospiraceae bacterium]|nr:MoxR family ATPase [Oscillospiraceae bacterium]